MRVFFAIWPHGKAQKQLAGLVQQLGLDSLCGGRKTKAENIHLTLVFVGEVDSSQVETLCQVAGEVERCGMKAFDIAIEKIRYWKHNSIVYGELSIIPQELMELVTALRNALSAAGFSLEERPYKPHITLMRNASCRTLPESMKPVSWRAREWVFIRSDQTSAGVSYVPIGRWSLS
jgi:2'-5' RNA ligase